MDMPSSPGHRSTGFDKWSYNANVGLAKFYIRTREKWWDPLTPEQQTAIKVGVTVVAVVAITAAVIVSSKNSLEIIKAADSPPPRKPETPSSSKNQKTGLSAFLDDGNMVVGSKYDGKIPNLSEMSDGHARRHRYADQDDFWTDRGYNRATSADMNKF